MDCSPYGLEWVDVISSALDQCAPLKVYIMEVSDIYLLHFSFSLLVEPIKPFAGYS